MKNLLFGLILLLVTGSLFAQAYEGPYPEIANGYGSFGAHPIAEKKFDNAYLLAHGHSVGDGGVEITIRYASDVAGPMPTVLFASGWGQYDPATFDKLLDFIASKGYCVVFTPYPTDQSNSSWETSLYEGMKQAIDENTGVDAGDLNIIDKTRIGFFGHSLGAGDIFWLGYKFYVDHGYGSNAKFLFSNAGWIGFNMTEDYLANYPSDCLLRVQIGEEDDVNSGNTSPRIQYYLFHQINIPSSKKNYVRVLSADKDGYHYSTLHSMVTTSSQYDALDFYAIFRPLDAMMDYTFNGNINNITKDIALGFDKSMGSLPDLDTDYNTFVFAHDESTYSYPCDVDGNPFQSACPAAPLPIEMLDPLAARLQGRDVLLSWSVSMESNNAGFDIQRSQDGANWETIGWVASRGDSYEQKRYEAIDVAPLKGINYYRFEQLDYDGRSSYSNVVSIKVNDLTEIRLAPNPASTEVAIDVASGASIEYVEIRTLAGKIVQIVKNPSHSLDISHLKPGVYQVSVQMQHGVLAKMLVVE